VAVVSFSKFVYYVDLAVGSPPQRARPLTIHHGAAPLRVYGRRRPPLVSAIAPAISGRVLSEHPRFPLMYSRRSRARHPRRAAGRILRRRASA
jgi:hypothetical protein